MKPMKPKILLVEDDPLDAAMIQEEIKSQLGLSIEVIATESDFVNKLPQIREEQPSLIIVDVMLRWARPSPDLTLESIPKEVREEGFYYAGLRCIDRLERDPSTKNIPSIIYTGLDRNNFTKHVVHTKSDDLSPLIDEVRKIIGISSR